MELTGKSAQDFSVWSYNSGRYVSEHYHLEPNIVTFWTWFGHLPQSMAYGFIVDFFDQCEVEGVEDTVQLECSYMLGGHTREEARNFAVEKNCKRYNQK